MLSCGRAIDVALELVREAIPGEEAEAAAAKSGEHFQWNTPSGEESE
jgi:hypothetical protein